MIKARVFWIGKATAINARVLLKKKELPLDATGRFDHAWNEKSGTVVGTDLTLRLSARARRADLGLRAGW